MGYVSSVIPIILAVYVQSYVEKFFKKIVPSFLQIIFVPLGVFLVMAPVTFIAIGPIGTVIGDFLGKGYNGIYGFSPLIAGAVMGGLWQVFVMFGMHWGFVPIMMLNLSPAGGGVDTLMPLLIPAVISQGGATLAVFFMTKDVKLKGLALSSTVTSLFGITEPAVYGVTLPLKKPFIAACVGGAIGSAFVGFSQVKNYSFGLATLFSLPNFIPKDTKSMAGVIAAIIGIVIAFVVAFVLTFILKFDDKTKSANETSSTNSLEIKNDNKKDKIVLTSPLTGTIVPLNKVEDQVFSSGALGKGIAVEPTVGELYAPADGEITTLFPTGHAVGITTADGAEVLMHIGMDTVEMDGDGFEILAKQGNKVKQGDLLIRFDIDKIKAAGHPIVTPIVVTNSGDFLDVLDMEQTDVLHGEDFLAIVR
ncbi:glucose PTS transporter subunit IIA [Enterococcus termitis]